MYVDEIRRQAEAVPRAALPAVSAALWKAFAAGQVSEADADALSTLIESRKALPTAIANPRKAVGSRPRTDASMERRRRWAASGRLPPALAARFTVAELAVLAVVAAETARHGRCSLAHGHLAAVAGVSISSVKRAMRAARDAGMLEISVRRVSAFRNDTNIVTVVSCDWLAWLRLARTGGGVQRRTGTHTQRSKKETKQLAEAFKWLPEGQGRTHRFELIGNGEDGRSRKAYVLGA